MKRHTAVASNGLLVAILFALAFWTIHTVSAGGQVAIHWGPDNRPDAWVGGAAVQLVNPIVALVVWFLLCMAPQGFSAATSTAEAAHRRFSSVFVIQLAIQLLVGLVARGLSFASVFG